MKKIKNVTITGVISPLSWECENYTNNIALLTSLDEEYIIDITTILGEGLLEFLFENVELTGTVRQTSYGTKLITVEKYKILDDYLANN